MTQTALRIPDSVASLFDGELTSALLSLREEIHGDPELSGEETRTAARLEGFLRDVGIADVKRVAGTGVVARIRGTGEAASASSGQKPAPVVAIRGDIDALPIQEQTGLPYQSRNPGVMHACGHDVHATWAAGAAALLAKKPARGDVLVVFQPAEEIGAGASAILDSGALDGVAAILGAHVDRRFAVGQVVVDQGPLAASTDTFTIGLKGKGAHAARPHESTDVIVALAAIIGSVQTIVARRLDPAIPGAVTIGSVNAGTASNVIPETAVLRGTIRAVDPASRTMMREELRRIVAGLASAHRVEAELAFDRGTPPLVNPAWPAAPVRAAASALLGKEAVVPLGTVNLAGEDFAYYMESIPGCFIRVGAREEGGEPIAAHTPWFRAAPESIFVGAAVLAEGARRISQENAGPG